MSSISVSLILILFINLSYSTERIPGGLAPRDAPQFVIFAFDNSVNVINIETYRSFFYNRHNSNGCKIGATFFVNHEYNDYQLTNELYRNGFEIALRSITNERSSGYWIDASYDLFNKEYRDQKIQMSHFANIPITDIKGMRLPFLKEPSNNMIQMMAGADLVYDSSFLSLALWLPGYWPYALNDTSSDESDSNIWELPVNALSDLDGLQCATLDSCFHVPEFNDEDGWFKLIVSNFERHYLTNRAPFTLKVQEWFLSNNPSVGSAVNKFIDMTSRLHDVFVVNSQDVIEWAKNPAPINEYREMPCPTRDLSQAQCTPFTCFLEATHNEMQFWMPICSRTCPFVYPWLCNPLGDSYIAECDEN